MSETKQSPSRPRKKELTLGYVKKQLKKIDNLSEYIIDKEENIVLKYYEVFDDMKIRELLTELQNHTSYDKENNLHYFQDDETLIQYLRYLIFKYFTKIHEKVGNSFEENKEVFEYFDRLGYVWLFNEKIFNPDELAKVYERFYSLIEIGTKALELDDETLQKLSNVQFANKLIKKDKIIPEA